MNAKRTSPAVFPLSDGSQALDRLLKIGNQVLVIFGILLGFANPAKAADLEFDNFRYIDNGSDITITGYVISPTGMVTIPDTIDSKPVVKIGYRAFFYRTGLVGMTVPKSVITVDTEAFAYCANMTYYSISASGDPVTTGNGAIGVGAFANCFALANVDVSPRTQSIGISAFYNCSALFHLSLPSLVTTIGSQAFRYCSNLANFTIPPAVTSLSLRTFSNCRGLTSITIPASVTTISTEVFGSCSSLMNIFVDPLNTNFSSIDGVLFNYAQTVLKAFPAGRGGGYVMPESVTTIETRAFIACKELVGVTFPSGLISISQEAFSTCSKLKYANFKGNSPIPSFNAFSLVSPDFAIYFLDGAEGFPVPPDEMFWYGYPAVNMGSVSSLAATWLLSKGFPASFDLKTDKDGDGVMLLMAWALNLDPYQNLSSSIPRPVISGNQMNLTFFAGAAGITYRVEKSNDLKNWNTEGVTLSAPDSNQMCTASSSVSGTSLYMRLAVSN